MMFLRTTSSSACIEHPHRNAILLAVSSLRHLGHLQASTFSAHSPHSPGDSWEGTCHSQYEDQVASRRKRAPQPWPFVRQKRIRDGKLNRALNVGLNGVLLNWNPLLLNLGTPPSRHLSVRHNTQQPAQTPPTLPPTPPPLLGPHCTVPATSNARRAFLVDTLAVMRRLEAQELSARQAEAITAVVTTVLNDSLESVAQAYTSKTDMQRSEMVQDATLSKFKTEMQSSLEHHFATLQRESERLRTDIEKMRSELRYEIDKVQANQRLDLNLERGHIRDELNKQQSETSNLTNKLDREIHTLKTQLEAAKYDVIKYCIGTIVSVTAVGLGLLRIIV